MTFKIYIILLQSSGKTLMKYCLKKLSYLKLEVILSFVSSEIYFLAKKLQWIFHFVYTVFATLIFSEIQQTANHEFLLAVDHLS